jgi:hypothetical protein
MNVDQKSMKNLVQMKNQMEDLFIISHIYPLL